MKRSTKRILTLGAICIIVGIIISATALIIWGIPKNKTAPTTIEITEGFESFSITDDVITSTDIRLVSTESTSCSIVYKLEKGILPLVSVENNTLNVKFNDNRPWYEKLYHWNNDDALVTIYLPEKQYNSLNISVNSGDFYAADINATSVKAKSSSGDISLTNIKATDIDITTTSGDIDTSNVTTSKLNTKASGGDIELDKTVADESLGITTTSGDIEIERCDSASINIKTSSGDVEASLLSAKVFDVHTSSGDVSVPLSQNGGGTCTINTASGDIKVYVDKSK